MDGWVLDVKAVLRIGYSNQKRKCGWSLSVFLPISDNGQFFQCCQNDRPFSGSDINAVHCASIDIEPGTKMQLLKDIDCRPFSLKFLYFLAILFVFLKNVSILLLQCHHQMAHLASRATESMGIPSPWHTLHTPQLIVISLLRGNLLMASCTLGDFLNLLPPLSD